ncbi:hypothetical protein CLOP_g24871 [Closterium sp. NIES-67]|nr:hypothetical protein CLOP_g24871 [Closterium sp. NIES-67]
MVPELQAWAVGTAVEGAEGEEEDLAVVTSMEAVRSFMVVYVDDILIFSPSSDLVKEVMLKLQDKFKCKTLGDVNYYLGLHIERDVEKRWMRPADMMTKRLVEQQHWKCCKLAGMALN